MKRSRLRSTVALAICCLASRAALADAPSSWVSTGGPVGGLGYDVRIHPLDKRMMFVTDNYAGVILSTDRGSSWRPSNSGITVRGGPSGDAYNIFSLTIDPNDASVVWAGTNGDNGAFGIFKSSDGGATWVKKTTGVTDGGFGVVFRGFTVQNGDSNLVYAQAEEPTSVNGREFNRTKGRVYKTTNGGDSWTLIWSGDSLARHLIIDPTDTQKLYLSTGIFDREANNSNCAAGLAGSGGVGALKSIDGGQNWSPINTGLTDLYVGAMRMHPTNPNVLYAATGNNACSGVAEQNIVSGLFRTTNGGASWDKLIGNDIFTTVGFSPSSPNVIYAASAAAFFRSSDDGATWQRLAKTMGGQWGPVGIRAGVPIDVVVDPDDPDTLYANNYGGGVFASSDGAQSWRVWSRGYSGAEIHMLAVPDTRMSSIYAIGRSGPFLSPNYGLDWIGIGNGDATFAEWYAVAVQPGNGDVVVISDEHQGFILRSTNAGASFVNVFHHPATDPSMAATRQGFKALAFAPSAPSVVYAGMAKARGTIDTSVPVGSVFYRSLDGGAVFTSPSADLDGKNVHRLVVDRANANVVWAATSAGVYTSADSGTTWNLLGLGGQDVIAVAVHPSNSNTLVASVKDVGIFVSSDAGASWPGGPYNTGLTNANPAVTALVFEPGGGVIYGGDFYSGVYRSLDGAMTWSPVPDAPMTGLTMRTVKDLAFAGGVLYAATQGGGVLRYGGPSVVPTPTESDFGTVTVGVSSPARTFTLFNTQVASRVLVDRALGGTNALDFNVTSDGCVASLAPVASCTFDVVFTPSMSGARSAVLNVQTDDPFGAIYPIALRGSGSAPVPDGGALVDASGTDTGTMPDGRFDDVSPTGSGGSTASGAAGTSGATGGAGPSSSTGGGAGAAGSGQGGAPNDARPASEGGCKCALGAPRDSLDVGWGAAFLAALWLFRQRTRVAVRR